MSNITCRISDAIKNGQSVIKLKPPTAKHTMSVFESWIYLAKVGCFYKIGYTEKLKRRLKGLFWQAHEEPILIAARKVPDGCLAEMWWHWHFRLRWAKSELFLLRPQDINEFYNWCKRAPEGLAVLG